MTPVMFGVIAGVIGAAFTPVFLRNNVSKNVRRTYENQKDTSIGPMVTDITSDGILISYWAGKSTTVWEGIQKAVLVPEYCYLFTGPNKAYIIPLKSITDFEVFQNEIVLNLAKEKLVGGWIPAA